MGLRDPPTQNLGKPRDPELSHPHRGRGGLDSQPPTHPPTQYTRHKHWTSFQKFEKFLQRMNSLFSNLLRCWECWSLFDETTKHPSLFCSNNVRFGLGRFQMLLSSFLKVSCIEPTHKVFSYCA